jgi:glutamyl-tRNA synthetase
LIPDNKLINTIKLVALKNALDFNNVVKKNVIMSKAFSFSKHAGVDIKSIAADINKIIDDISSLPLDSKKTLYEELIKTHEHYLIEQNEGGIPKSKEMTNRAGSASEKGMEKIPGLPPLEEAVHGKVVTRFPPEPNGYPHIGHAKAAVIDEEYAKAYGGRLILRFDDTNPAKEKLEYYDAILEGIRWLNIKPQIIKNASDDLDILIDYGRKLIENNCAYVCECSSELVKINRQKGMECNCRKNKTETNLTKFERLKLGKYSQNEAIVRYRGNMSSLNTAMRDPTLFRVIEGNHPKVGTNYCLWPTYDFAAPIEDSLDGVTHAFRTKEYELRNEVYFSILSDLKLRKPRLIEFSRLEFEGIPVSKRKITPLIEKGIIKRWDDPRLPTLVGLERRGILPEAIRKFVLTLGITLSETKPSMEVLESFNRKILDRHSMRLYFVKDPVELHLDKLDINQVEIKNHPHLDLGRRTIPIEKIIYISSTDAINLKIGDTVRLMELCNIEIESIGYKKNDNVVGDDDDSNRTVISAKNIGNTVSHEMQKIQWVSKIHSFPYKIYKPQLLYYGDKYNENSLLVDQGLVEQYIAKLNIGTILQFVRYGFCRIDDDSSAIFTHR